MKTAMKKSVKPAMKKAMKKATKLLLIDTKWVKEMMVEIGPDGWVQVWKRFASLT